MLRHGPAPANPEHRRIPIVEDAAQAIGAEDHGRRAGTMGAIGCFSFYPTKNLGAAGDAGMLVTSDAALNQRLRKLRVHGGATEFHHDEVGINSRLDALQAALLRVKLQHLDDWTEARRRRANSYTELIHEAKIADWATPPFVRPETRHIFHQYVIRTPGNARHHLESNIIANLLSVPLIQEYLPITRYKRGNESRRAARETSLVCSQATDEQ